MSDINVKNLTVTVKFFYIYIRHSLKVTRELKTAFNGDTAYITR